MDELSVLEIICMIFLILGTISYIFVELCEQNLIKLKIKRKVVKFILCFLAIATMIIFFIGDIFDFITWVDLF